MIRKEIDHMNLKQIADSGQCFRWKELGPNRYSVVAFGRYLEIKQEGKEFVFSCDEKEWEEIWYNYFDMDTDYARIEELILSSGDAHLREAFEYGSGMRILRQDLWEIIVSFMISQNNNIKRIKNSVAAVCEKGANIIHMDESNGVVDYCFPECDKIDLEIFDDSSLGLGYRNSYLKDIYEFARENPNWLENLKKLSYDEAMEELLKRKGIGKKVANCICLFGLHHVGAFPIDTHVKQFLEKYYKEGFDFDRYEGIAGIIQQYLFYYEISAK